MSICTANSEFSDLDLFLAADLSKRDTIPIIMLWVVLEERDEGDEP